MFQKRDSIIHYPNGIKYIFQRLQLFLHLEVISIGLGLVKLCYCTMNIQTQPKLQYYRVTNSNVCCIKKA